MTDQQKVECFYCFKMMEKILMTPIEKNLKIPNSEK